MTGLIIIFIALVANAFFSGTEMAFVTLNRFKIRHLVETGNKSAIKINHMFAAPEIFLGMTLVGNNIFIVTASIVADHMAVKYFAANGMFLSSIVMTFIILLFCEILPKAFFRRHAEKIMLKCAFFLEILNALLSPFTKVILFFSGVIFKVLGHDIPEIQSVITREEIKFIAKHSENVDRHDKEHAVMIDRALNINKIKIADIMIPVEKAVMIDIDASVSDALNLTKQQHYSRIPVFDKKKEKVKGLINIYDILFNEKEGVTDIKSYLRQPYFIYKTETIGRALHLLKDSRRPLAFVIDNNKEFYGIVTLEDIIRKIVGQVEV